MHDYVRMGNDNRRATPDGVCVRNIYDPPGVDWFNLRTGERGTVVADHFIPAEVKRYEIENFPRH